MESSNPSYITAMIEKLVVLGQEQIKKGNLRKAKTAFEYSYKKAKLIDNVGYQETSLVNLAAVYISGERSENAVECLNAVLRLGHSETNLGDVHYNLAIAHEMLKHVAEAAKEYELALSAYKTANSPSGIISNVAVKIAMFHMKHGRSKKAVGYFNVAARILSEKELIIQLATLLCLKSRCLMSSDDTMSDAIQVCEESLKLCKSIEQDIFVVQVYNELGLILTECKAFEISSQCYRLALSVCEDLDYDSVAVEKKAALIQNLGAVLNPLGKFDEAIKHSQRAAEIYGTKGVRSSQCHCFLNIAFSYSQKSSSNSLDKCEEYYLHALQAAKDTGSLRDQWQSLEGLGGVALGRGQSAKAAEFYQKAVGICASLELNNREQERLVRKLSACLKMKLPPNRNYTAQSVHRVLSALSPQSVSHPSPGTQLPAGVEVARVPTPQQMPLTAGLDLRNESLIFQPQTELSFYRPANVDARREEFAPKLQVTEATTESETRVRKKKKKRVRRLSIRRLDQENHPIHGMQQFVHHGLGTYVSTEDQTRMYHLSTEDISRKGQRRYHGVDASSNVSGALHIQGLAVDDPSEPQVGTSSRTGNHYDTLDSADVVRVRPMSSKIRHRRSTIPNTGMDLESTDETSETFGGVDSSADVDDYCPDSLGEEEEEITSAGEQEKNVRQRRQVNGKERDFYSDDQSEEERARVPRQRRDVYEGGLSGKDATIAADNKEYGSVVSAYKRTQSAVDKGKRPMSSKVLTRKTSIGVRRAAGDTSYQEKSHNSALLKSESEDDEEAMRANMRRISNFDTTDSEDKVYDKADTAANKQGVHFEARSDTGSESDLPSDQDKNAATYEKPLMSTVSGGNFFKSAGNRSKDPLYESIVDAQSTTPDYKAPPELPPRNYTVEEKGEFSQTSEDGSVDLSAMTRGERDSYLYQRQQQSSVKVIKWEGKVEKVTPARKQGSEVCSVM